MRRAARVDGNQSRIVAALRKIGASVQHLHMVGDGCPDILVGYESANILLEIKDDKHTPSKRNLTLDEKVWHDEWRGQVAIVNNEQEAVDYVMALRRAGL